MTSQGEKQPLPMAMTCRKTLGLFQGSFTLDCLCFPISSSAVFVGENCDFGICVTFQLQVDFAIDVFIEFYNL